ncbi:hypothetical protein DVA81_19950, partial [Acinetobacter baumannii]
PAEITLITGEMKQPFLLFFSGQIIACNTEKQNLPINISFQSDQTEAEQLSQEMWWKEIRIKTVHDI